MNSLLSFIILAKTMPNLLWIRVSPQNAPPPTLPTSDAAAAAAEGHESHETDYNIDSQVMMMQWSLVGLCIAATVQSLQNPELLHHKSYNWICMVLVFSLTSVSVSMYIPRSYKLASLLLVQAGVFFAVTAFVVALAVTLLPSFMLTSIVVYSLGILTVILTNLLKPSRP